MQLFEMKQNHEAALAKAETLLTAAETGGRPLSAAERVDYDAAMAEANALAPQIHDREALNTMRSKFPKGRVLAEPGTAAAAKFSRDRVFSAEYANDFAAWAASRGITQGASLSEGADEMGGFAFPSIPSRRSRMQSALYESTSTAGGFAVPSQVDGQFVPLAPPEMGVYSLVNVVPTVMDTRYTRKDLIGTAAAKPESNTATPTTFGGTDPAVGQFTLSAFMMGHAEDASWELLQDVPQFQSFMEDDELLSLSVLREAWILSGSGVGMSQGILGNVGAGVQGATADDSGNLLSIDATELVLADLNSAYHPNASWLMARATSIGIRKAQRQANLFDPVFSRVGKTDYLHGYPVTYSSAMPSATAGNTPVLFGDFKAGYIFGERGGAGVNVKILDQPKALQGLLTVLAYQRVDGRVRRSEAIQGITLHS